MSTEDIFTPDAEVAAEFTELLADPAAREAFTSMRMNAAKTGAARRYDHVLAAVSETPWAVKPQMLALIIDLIALRVAGENLTAAEIDARIGTRRPNAMDPPTGVAVLALHGVIMPKASMMNEVSGGVSIDSFRQQFRQALAAKDVSGIVLDVDSPGGMVDGVPEMAAEIRASRGTKPIVAVANAEASSAAYWLASQADEFVVTKSGRVGSIGVYAAHKDETAKAENEGIKTTLVSAGKYKTEGNPYAPLSDDAKAHLQTMVDEYYGMFTSDVAKGRRVNVNDVRSGFGEGRELVASQALRAGMVDRVATTEQIVYEMLGAQQLKQTAAAFTDLLTVGASLGAETAAAPFNEHGAEVAEMIDDGEHFAAAVDNSTWDGNRAMGMCNSAADYASICAATHTIGQPGERQHYALPHHYLGRGPNADGTRAALSRVPQTQNITDAARASAQRHLDAHMREVNPNAGATAPTEETQSPIAAYQAKLDALRHA